MRSSMRDFDARGPQYWKMQRPAIITPVISVDTVMTVPPMFAPNTVLKEEKKALTDLPEI